MFLDRDGVVIRNQPDYVKSWSDVHFLPGAFEALRRLSASDYAIVFVTNQSAVGRGLLPLEDVLAIHRRITAEIEARGGRIDGSYLCPHRPDEGCACRKPAPGMFFQAASELGLDLARSHAVGDAATDLQAAEAAGVSGILVLTGISTRASVGGGVRNPRVEADLAAAVDYILAHPEARR